MGINNTDGLELRITFLSFWDMGVTVALCLMFCACTLVFGPELVAGQTFQWGSNSVGTEWDPGLKRAALEGIDPDSFAEFHATKNNQADKVAAISEAWKKKVRATSRQTPIEIERNNWLIRELIRQADLRSRRQLQRHAVP